MENHSLATAGANTTPAGQSVLNWKNAAAMATATLGLLVGDAGAAELAPVASQVMAVEVAVSTLKGLGLSEKKMKQFQALSPENQSAAMFFYHGLKTGNADFQKEGMTKIIRLLAFHEENKQGLATLKATPNARVGLNVMSDTIAELSDPKTYGAILTSPQSPYSSRFVAIRDDATKVFAEAKPLQEAARNMDSPELVAAKKRNEATQRELARLESQAAELQKTNAALGRVVSSFR